MKTIFTIIFLSFFTNFSFAQYQSLFGVESTSWDMSAWYLGIFDPYPSLDIYHAAADTIIDGKHYKKIQSSYFYIDNDDDNYLRLSSYLREDTLQGKAWSITFDGTEWKEYLIVDLTLEVGDTFVIKDIFHPTTDIYPVVDSVYYYEGRKFLRFDYEYNPSNFPGVKFKMIEGVGTNIGVFYQPLLGLIDFHTLCQSKDGTQSYVNNSPYFLGRCDVSAVAVNERKKPEYQLNIFPNPTSDQTIIDLPNELVLDKNKGIPLKLIDVSGRIMLSKKVASFPYKLDASSLTTGVYLVLVGDIAVGKFLKN